MAKAQPKLVLAPAQGIPFNMLVLSQSNVRRVKNGVSIEDLVGDIERRGLLQGLSVRPLLDAGGEETGTFHVPAGGRRFRALEILVRRKRLAADAVVPCVVKPADGDVSPEEDSYAENVFREALHPLDEFRGMQQLVDQGGEIEDVAARFHVTPAVVRQRLKLACVSPVLHKVYAANGLSLEQLMAFTVSDDHARQEQVWELVQSHHNQSAHFIRARLNETTVPARDPRVLFVGVEKYVAAGGCVVRDLFEEDRGGWLQDAVLLDRLVLEKLNAEADRIRAEGWKWVEAAIDLPYGSSFGMRVIEAVHTPASETDLAEVATLQAEADALEAEWSGADEVPDEVDGRVTALDERIAELAGGTWTYDPAEMAIAGVFLTIDRTGAFEIDPGWVRAEDEPVVEAEPGADGEAGEPGDQRREGHEPGSGHDPAAGEVQIEEEDEGLKPLPDRLVSELTAERTLALQDAIAGNPQVAFAAVLHNFVLATFYYGRTESCLEISLSRVGFAFQPSGMKHNPAALAIEARHAKWKERLPQSDKALWDALVQLDGTEQAELFAHCAAYAANALFEPVKYDNGRVSPHTIERRIAHSHILARAVALDMVSAGWQPTADNYFGKVTKARIVEAVTEGKGAEAAGRIEHLRKPDMAREAEQLMHGSGWIPKPLRTPQLPAQAELTAPAERVDLPAFNGDDGETEPMAIAAE